jgi:LEA14-like dessication related protein
MRVLTTAALVCLVAAASCTSVEPPEVTLTGVEFVGLSTEGLSLILIADVADPNGIGGRIRDLEYSVYVDGTKVGQGQQVESVLIPSDGTTVQAEIPFLLRWEGAKEGLQDALHSGQHEWNIKGSAKLQKSGMSRTFKFDEHGTFGSRGGDVDF